MCLIIQVILMEVFFFLFQGLGTFNIGMTNPVPTEIKYYKINKNMV